MRGFNHATILSPSFHGLHRERLAQWPAFCDPQNGPKIPGGYFQKNWVGCAARSLKPLPYFRPDQNFDTLFSDLKPWSLTSCYGMYTLVGVNIKREIVLWPNDEEVANSSKKNIPNSRL